MAKLETPRKTSSTVGQTDSLAVDIGLRDQQRTAVATALAGCLATTYTLYITTLFYHWNVTGPNFASLHKLFNKQYEALHAAGDEVAERIRALGHKTPGSFSEFEGLSSVKEDKQLPASAEAMVSNLLHANEAASQAARRVFKVAEESEDEVTADMMIDRMAYHDEQAWMLRAILE